jgi:hypothetical protein
MLPVIFSKDRAYQLDGLLHSLAWATGEPLDATVLYTVSTEQHERQYQQLQREWHGGFVHGVRFILQSNFGEDMQLLLRMARRVLLLTDDSIFTHHVDLRAVDKLLDVPEVLGVSLRLGRNTTHCWMAGRDQVLPTFTPADGGALTFRWTDADGDFGYPFDLSSSAYRTDDLIPYVGDYLLRTPEDILPYLESKLRGPNHMEDTLWGAAHEFIDRSPWLACFETSAAFACPWNRTAADPAYARNRAGEDPELSAQALADAFDRGGRFDVAQYRGLVTRGAHEITQHYRVIGG